MWSAFVSQKTKDLLDFFSSSREKNAILDPLSCMVRLAILAFKPKGTKISFSNNKISFHEPCIMQGPIRWSQGDNREDLHNLFQPIKKALMWYDIKNENIKFIFKLSVLGIRRLQTSYTYNSLITHSLEHYYTYIETRLDKSVETEAIDNNKLFKQLRTLWSDNEINIMYNILTELKNSTKENYEPMIKALESILTHKEKLVNDIILEHSTLLE